MCIFLIFLKEKCSIELDELMFEFITTKIIAEITVKCRLISQKTNSEETEAEGILQTACHQEHSSIHSDFTYYKQY